MNITIEHMTPMDTENYPKNSQGEINPFQQDICNMGQDIGQGLTLMYANHDTKPCHFLIIVDKVTGERQKIIINRDYSASKDLPNS